MIEFIHQYDGLLSSAGRLYTTRVYAERLVGGRWQAWFVFLPVSGGRALATNPETTQVSLGDVRYWATGITPVYLEGALARAVDLQPERQVLRRLGQVERLERQALAQAAEHEREAAAARAEALAAHRLREEAELDLAATVEEEAAASAAAHERAAELARAEAEAAGRLKAEREREMTAAANAPRSRSKSTRAKRARR